MSDRAAFDADSPLRMAPWGFRGAGVVASLYATPVPEDGVSEVRRVLPGPPAAGVTQLGDVLVCRILARTVREAWPSLAVAWQTIRPLILDRPACTPRIWAT